MQVSQIAELDSHAVIGGSTPQSFFMAQSAEFFTILSDTLYRDKKLAVVREVICNAHDAHVMSDCVDLPIEITLTDEELIIKDFGPGIHDDNMHQTYCGYGHSTKVADITQTGGFGLGCKAPFAYSDHFTVTSCHQGMKSLYAISRGGLESDGLPSMRRMVRVPTDQSGISVSIPLKNKSDRLEFHRLITKVIKNGGIKAQLNKNDIYTNDYTGIEKSGFGLMRSDGLDDSHVYVKLGVVLYPVSSENPELTKLVGQFKNNNSLRLIISANPGDVGITPSREALSNSDETVAFLTERLAKINRHLCALMPTALRKLADQQAAKEPTPTCRLSLMDISSPLSSFTGTPSEVALYYLKTTTDEYSNQLPQFSTAAGSIHKALLKAAGRKHKNHRRFFRRVVNPVVAKMMKDRFGGHYIWKAETGRLLVKMVTELGIMKDVCRFKGDRFYPLTEKMYSFAKQPTVVLVRSKTQALDTGYGRDDTIIVIARNMKSHEIQKIRDKAKHYKIELKELDLSKPAPVKKQPKIVTEKALFYSLSHVNGEYYKPRLNINATKIGHAPVFFDCRLVSGSNEFRKGFKPILKRKNKILKLYPKVALAMSAAEKKALLAAGSRELVDVFTEEFLSIKNTTKNLFVVLSAKSDLFRETDDVKLGRIANNLAKSDLRYAKILMGQSIKVSVSEERTFDLFRLYYPYMFDDYKSDNKLMELAEKLFKQSLDHQIKKADLHYLDPLVQISESSYPTNKSKWSVGMADMIRFLKKRYEKSQQTDEQPMKEAA